MKLLTINNTKTRKGEAKGWLTGILHLAPARVSGYNVCPWSTKECRKVCLNTAGCGRFNSVQAARIRKTRELFRDRPQFISQLCRDIESLCRQAKRLGLKPVIRLNGTSDIAWETEAFGKIPQRYPDVQFYDYSKSLNRVMINHCKNYRLVFSYSGHNHNACVKAIRYKIPVAIVFENKVPVGVKIMRCRVIDGDLHDLVFTYKKPVIIGLKAKGLARKVRSVFTAKEDQFESRTRTADNSYSTVR